MSAVINKGAKPDGFGPLLFIREILGARFLRAGFASGKCRFDLGLGIIREAAGGGGREFGHGLVITVKKLLQGLDLAGAGHAGLADRQMGFERHRFL